MRVVITFVCSIILVVQTMSYAQQSSPQSTIDFRYGSEVLYGAFGENAKALSNAKALATTNWQSLIQNQGHIRLVSVVPNAERGNIAAINFASIRGAVVKQWLMDNFTWLKESNFAFYIQHEENRNAVEVSYVGSSIENTHQSDIFFSLDKSCPEKVDYAVARYESVPFLDGSTRFEKTDMDFKIINPLLDKTQVKILEDGIDEKVIITIYYRWDKDNLDATYLTNTEMLRGIDSLMNLPSANYVDSLRIVAYASPEGHPDYNKRLSERRATTLKNYIIDKYPNRVESAKIITDARGENWNGFRRMAVADSKLPMKEQILAIIDNTNITDSQRQAQIVKLDGGRLYKNYILPNYYRYLRSGASLFVIYNPAMPVDVNFEPITVVITEPESEPILIVKPEPESKSESKPEPVIKYPIALRTNLLYAAVGVANLGIEVPFGKAKNWSWIVDGAYSYWHSPQNLHALQTLEYGTELKYWFGVNKRRKAFKPNWTQPLKGFYIGAYGRYWQRYDIQFIDGYQGDASWSAGLTAGYAIPINGHLSFDFGIGGGWIATSEYRHYHQPEYDENGKYHLMWQETGTWSGLSLTKVRFSLVWLIQTKKGRECR